MRSTARCIAILALVTSAHSSTALAQTTALPAPPSAAAPPPPVSARAGPGRVFVDVRSAVAVVTAPDAVVRTAPFEVAPELTHVHAGDKLPADDRPQGTWRRVRLPYGQFGLVHDADVKVTVTTSAVPAPPPPGYGYPPPGYGYPPPGYGYPPDYTRPGAAVVNRPGAATHDGFYMRLHIGVGYGAISASDSGGAQIARFSGQSSSFGIAAGFALTENLILYGTFLFIGISNPTGQVRGVVLNNPEVSVQNVALGAGLVYYLEPLNLYFSGTLLANQIYVTDFTGKVFSNSSSLNYWQYGAGFQGLVGKEWWVSNNWGLGVAAELIYGQMNGDNDTFMTGAPPSWTATSFALLFSATYN